MPFVTDTLQKPRPDSLAGLQLPRRERRHPSPVDWRDEVLYFLLADRFSDGREATRPLLDRDDRAAARAGRPDGSGWRWDRWARSGRGRWQGGTLAGVTLEARLPARPRRRPRSGSARSSSSAAISTPTTATASRTSSRSIRASARATTSSSWSTTAHAAGCASSSTSSSTTPATTGSTRRARRAACTSRITRRGRYPFGAWRGADGAARPGRRSAGAEDGVWPAELQDRDAYTRAGTGSLGAGDLDDADAEHKRTDFEDLRDFALDAAGDAAAPRALLQVLDRAHRLRRLPDRHAEARLARAGAQLLRRDQGVRRQPRQGELLPRRRGRRRRRDAGPLSRRARSATSTRRSTSARCGPRSPRSPRGCAQPTDYFAGFDPERSRPRLAPQRSATGTSRSSTTTTTSSATKLRFSAGRGAADHQVVAGVAIQLFTLGIPCIYYGTEQALRGPGAVRAAVARRLGRARPCTCARRCSARSTRGADGRAGLHRRRLDHGLPGFGAFGTAGRHCFDDAAPGRSGASQALARTRAAARSCATGGSTCARSRSSAGFAVRGGGELLAWSRILDDEEALCVVNAHGTAAAARTSSSTPTSTPARRRLQSSPTRPRLAVCRTRLTPSARASPCSVARTARATCPCATVRLRRSSSS